MLLNLPPCLPQPKVDLLEKLVQRLASVAQMQAVVLGGSYASGTSHPASDLDVGLYYLEAEPFSLEPIKQIAQEFSQPDSQPTVTGLYEWGTWVNGGAWIHTDAGKLDFLYRNLDQISRTIHEAEKGIWRHDYDQQPTNGYYSTGYLAEIEICIPLVDPGAQIAALKQQVQVYPPLLKQTILRDSLWSAEFTLQHARGFSEKGDVYNSAGCLVRAANSLTQALFALNERYFLTDKKVLDTLSAFRLVPPGYAEKIASILACPGTDQTGLTRAVAEMEQAWNSVSALTEEMDRSKL